LSVPTAPVGHAIIPEGDLLGTTARPAGQTNRQDVASSSGPGKGEDLASGVLPASNADGGGHSKLHPVEGESMQSFSSLGSHSTWLPAEHLEISESREQWRSKFSGWTGDELAAYIRLNSNIDFGRALANLVDEDGWTIANDAASSGMLQVLKAVASAGMDITTEVGTNAHSPLHDACIHGHADCLSLLLAMGANPEAMDMNGDGPLHWAAFRGHRAVVATLIHEGRVNISARNSDGGTALHSAAN